MAPAPLDPALQQQIREAKAADPSLSSREIGRQFGLHSTTILKYWAASSEATTEETPNEPIIEEESDEWKYGKHWVYNSQTETYIVHLKCRPKPLVIGKTKMQAMKRAYSNWDKQPATINEITRRFSIPRDQFMELKAVFGWTHDQEPFTAEDVLERPVGEMVDDALQQKRQVLFETFQKSEWQQIKKDAEKWNNLEQSFILPMTEHIGTFLPAYVPSLFNIKESRNPFAVVANTGELHYGKAGWVGETGEEYNRDIAQKRLANARQHMLEEVADKGRPEKFFWSVGDDFLHIDNDQNSTTAGTGQDCDGSAARIFSEGLELLIRDADSLLAVAPLDMIYVRGNHDSILSYAMFHCLKSHYRNDPRVTAKVGADERDYTTYGNTLIGWAHGCGALKPKDFMSTMAKEARLLWSATKYRMFVTGHLHSEVVRELIGGRHYQHNSLSGKDRYHARNGYLSEAGMDSYLIDKERGPSGSILWVAE
jgi:hypothetical protein